MSANGADQEVNELSYQACYIFKPPAPSENDDQDDRPTKRRKVNHNKTHHALEWPRLCAGAETPELASLRQRAFQTTWATVEKRLEDVSRRVDDTAADKIITHIKSDDLSSRKLKTAIVVSGYDNSILGQCLERVRNSQSKDILVELQASQAPNIQAALKSLIRGAIEAHSGAKGYSTFMTAYKRAVPMPYDLELLQRYITLKKLGNVVVALPDAETFDLHVFSELLSNLASWTDKLQFRLVIGLATTVSLFESRLAKSTLRQLEAQVFALDSSGEKLFDMLAAVHPPNVNSPIPYLGSSVVSTLYELSQDQATTTRSFAQTVKYCLMMHYYANPLSALSSTLESEIDAASLKVLCECVRNTPSFQEYCNRLATGQTSDATKTIRQILSSDSDLLRRTAEEMAQTMQHMQYSVETIRALARLCHALEPTTSAFSFYQQFMIGYGRGAVVDTDAWAVISDRLPSIPQASLPELIIRFSSQLSSDHHILDSVRSSSTPAAFCETITAESTGLDPRSYIREAFLLSSRGPLTTTTVSRPRLTAERALSIPADYLGCTCCSGPDWARRAGTADKEGTALLYALLSEAGREVNAMDLWTTFNGVVQNESETGVRQTNGKATPRQRPKAKASTKATAKVNGTAATADDPEQHETRDNDGERLQRAALTRFYIALAELKYLGLVKSTSDRRLNKGVEVLSRTTWIGL
jgi:origin recognition complex subunit 3